MVSVGNASLKMHYVDALKLSTQLRLVARRAKREFGDTATNWGVIARLTDVVAEERREQTARVATAPLVPKGVRS